MKRITMIILFLCCIVPVGSLSLSAQGNSRENELWYTKMMMQSPNYLVADIGPTYAKVSWNQHEYFGSRFGSPCMIYLDGVYVGSTYQREYEFKNLTPATKYRVSVNDTDTGRIETIYFETPGIAYVSPYNLRVNPHFNRIDLSWNESAITESDPSASAIYDGFINYNSSYSIYLDNRYVGSTNNSHFTIGNLDYDTKYKVKVVDDNNGNVVEREVETKDLYEDYENAVWNPTIYDLTSNSAGLIWDYDYFKTITCADYNRYTISIYDFTNGGIENIESNCSEIKLENLKPNTSYYIQVRDAEDYWYKWVNFKTPK